MSPPQQLRQQTSNCSSLLIYRPRKDGRLSWPSWLTYSGWLTHICGHISATSRAQDSESTSAKDQCSTAGPRNQLPHTSPAGVRSVAMSVSVCLSVRSIISKNDLSNFMETFVQFTRGSVLLDYNTIRYLLPVLWMTSRLPIVGHTAGG